MDSICIQVSKSLLSTKLNMRLNYSVWHHFLIMKLQILSNLWKDNVLHRWIIYNHDQHPLSIKRQSKHIFCEHNQPEKSDLSNKSNYDHSQKITLEVNETHMNGHAEHIAMKFIRTATFSHVSGVCREDFLWINC